MSKELEIQTEIVPIASVKTEEITDDIKKLMYYLDCVSCVTKVDIPSKYTAFQSSEKLSVQEKYEIINLAKQYSIDWMIANKLFVMVETELESFNKFVWVKAHNKALKITFPDKKIMTLNDGWAKIYYHEPIKMERSILDPLTNLQVNIVVFCLVVFALSIILASKSYQLYLIAVIPSFVGIIAPCVQPFTESKRNKAYNINLCFLPVFIIIIYIFVMIEYEVFFICHVIAVVFGFAFLSYPLRFNTIIEESMQADELLGNSPLIK